MSDGYYVTSIWFNTKYKQCLAEKIDGATTWHVMDLDGSRWLTDEQMRDFILRGEMTVTSVAVNRYDEWPY